MALVSLRTEETKNPQSFHLLDDIKKSKVYFVFRIALATLTGALAGVGIGFAVGGPVGAVLGFFIGAGCGYGAGVFIACKQDDKLEALQQNAPAKANN